MLYSLMKHVLIGPALTTLYTPEVQGIENVPQEGPAILASNHLSFSDSFFLPLVVDRKITFLAKSDYFNGPGVRGWMTKQFFSGVGQVPIDRSGGSASSGAIETGVRVLRAGSCWASTRKAPGPRTAGSTEGAPVRPGWPWQLRRRSSRSR